MITLLPTQFQVQGQQGAYEPPGLAHSEINYSSHYKKFPDPDKSL